MTTITTMTTIDGPFHSVARGAWVGAYWPLSDLCIAEILTW